MEKQNDTAKQPQSKNEKWVFIYEGRYDEINTHKFSNWEMCYHFIKNHIAHDINCIPLELSHGNINYDVQDAIDKIRSANGGYPEYIPYQELDIDQLEMGR